MLSENVITISAPEKVDLFKYGVCIDLDRMPVTITKDSINYDFQEFIEMLIDKKLNAEAESNNPCNRCQEFDCTYCEYNHR